MGSRRSRRSRDEILDPHLDRIRTLHMGCKGNLVRVHEEAHGSGADAVPAEQMRALAERFGFVFEAHAVGDANRSARVAIARRAAGLTLEELGIAVGAGPGRQPNRWRTA